MSAYSHAARLAAHPNWIAEGWAEIAHDLANACLPRTDPADDDLWAAWVAVSESRGAA